MDYRVKTILALKYNNKINDIFTLIAAINNFDIATTMWKKQITILTKQLLQCAPFQDLYYALTDNTVLLLMFLLTLLISERLLIFS